MRRKKRIDDELRKVSDHLFYEVWMFNILADSMMSGIFGEGVLNNAVLESFCVHSRVILDFLFSQKPKKDDVVAEDFYIRSDEWYKGSTPKNGG
jgi:hypothetical protein